MDLYEPRTQKLLGNIHNGVDGIYAHRIGAIMHDKGVGLLSYPHETKMLFNAFREDLIIPCCLFNNICVLLRANKWIFEPVIFLMSSYII